MSEVAIEKVACEEVVHSVLADVRNGRIDDAVAHFAEDFNFNDYGIGLQFTSKERLAEFLKKTREVFPDSCLEIDSLLMGLDHAVGEWTLRTSLTEPLYAGKSRKVPILLHGVSVVKTKYGKITDWSDYYDGLTSRRTALASHFEEWVEL